MRLALDRGLARIFFGGDWVLKGDAPSPAAAVMDALKAGGASAIELVPEGLGRWDTSLLAAVMRLTAFARGKNIPCSADAFPPGFRRLLALALAVPPNEGARRSSGRAGFLESLGALVLAVPATCRSMLEFIGETAVGFARFFLGRSVCRRRDISLQFQECGAEALPIVSLISLLVGFILAFVGVVQLRMFGAQIYVSSLVAVGMTRIMGAIMTGIIMAGRTGASFAAVLGTMQVNEEIDALATQGLPPVEFLVLPRVIALSLMTPLLVLYADFMGIIGGFIVGVGMLGLDPAEYFTFTRMGFGLSNLWVGLAHGFVFGCVVAVTGCYQGLRCGRSAAAVGTATTAAVVFSIVGIVIATAILTFLFNIVGI